MAVLARGLGLRLLVCRFLRLYSDTALAGHRLVFVLNVVGEEQAFWDALIDEGCPEESLPKVITNETSAKEREALYKRGGVFMVTSRILIVDLLNSVVDTATIHGFLVHHAHKVHEATTEAFILRIFRQVLVRE